MKKNIVTISLLTLLITACNQGNDFGYKDNRVVESQTIDKSNAILTCIITVGHSVSDCNNSCISVNGQRIHVDCQGEGHLCRLYAHLSITQSADCTYIATTTDTLDLTDQLFFNMPARSLCTQANLSGKSTWLNIPAQVSYRDSTTRQFTLTGLFYTDYQYYNNN